MRNHLIAVLAAGMLGLFLLPVIFGQTANPSRESKPVGTGQDLSGVWLARPFHPALFPKGTTAPFTPWGEAQFKLSDPQKNDPTVGCLPHGMPRLMFVPLPMEILQVPGKIVIFQEAVNQVRQIHLNRQHPADLYGTYTGDSVGKWEGDTLVVDTVGLNDVTWMDHVGLPHSDALHIVERIHRVNHDTLQDDFTIDDPKTFTKSWTTSQTYVLKPDWEIQEYVCDNNKYSYQPKQ